MRNSCSFFALLLLYFSCGSAPITGDDADRVASAGATNIRMARATAAGGWEAVEAVTRDPDHLGQEIPFKYQMEGPAWENENVGFRMYWDERNGIDIFGKRVRHMVLDSVGINRADGKDQNYHELADWGMDVLKVGNSLGAGSIGLMVGDSAYRLGDVREETYRLLEEGPEGSRFLLTYRGWLVAGRELDVDWEISIVPGTWGYESSVTVAGLQGGEELITGIVNLHSDTVYTKTTSGRYVMYTYGPQAELDNVLGMAISADEDAVAGAGEFAAGAEPIASTYYLRLKLRDGMPATYRFTAGWEPGHAAFADRAAFEAAIY